jgi:hypothetical protein
LCDDDDDDGDAAAGCWRNQSCWRRCCLIRIASGGSTTAHLRLSRFVTTNALARYCAMGSIFSNYRAFIIQLMHLIIAVRSVAPGSLHFFHPA